MHNCIGKNKIQVKNDKKGKHIIVIRNRKLKKI